MLPFGCFLFDVIDGMMTLLERFVFIVCFSIQFTPSVFDGRFHSPRVSKVVIFSFEDLNTNFKTIIYHSDALNSLQFLIKPN